MVTLGLAPLHYACQHETTTCFAEHLTFKPTLYRRMMRSLIEGLRIVLPVALAIGVGYMIVLQVIDVTVAYGWCRFWHSGFSRLAVWYWLLFDCRQHEVATDWSLHAKSCANVEHVCMAQ